MLSINTNLPSLIAQNSLKNSTLSLNTAVERMSTGYKINGAKDNAANYSISTNMGTKLSSYGIAQDNVAAGMDLVSTASESLSLISDKLSRLRALAEQASNGTYGEQSLGAINAEARAIVDETNRIFNTTEYNGNKLFGHSGKFSQDIEERDTSTMTKLESVSDTDVITSGTYSISSAEELAKLATMADNEKIQGGEYVLANDIDLSAYSTGAGWNPIGDYDTNKIFKGTFDGNGHIISNLYINRPGGNCFALFSAVDGTIENLGLENVNVTGGNCTSALCGVSAESTETKFENCYIYNGKITAVGHSGALCGQVRTSMATIKSCYSENLDFITGAGGHTGGLVGNFICYSLPNRECLVEDSYSIGCNINAKKLCIGGLIGNIGYYGLIRNCYSNNNITGITTDGGIEGGLIGNIYSSTQNETLTIEDCYAAGNVKSNSNSYGDCGGFIGCIQTYSSVNINIKRCYSTGDVYCQVRTGGFIGRILEGNVSIDNCYSSGVVSGNNYIGGLVGYKGTTNDLKIKNSYVLGESDRINGVFLGYNSYSSGNNVIENCKYNSYYEGSGKPLMSGSGVSSATIENNTTCDSTAPYKLGVIETNLQVGIYGNKNSQIGFETSFSLKGICDLYKLGLDDKDYLGTIDELINRVSSKQTEFGSVQNRLDSALDEISTQYENLTSSRSTLRDADIAEVSSQYIRQQILQQASATLMATANQCPALALQLI